MAENDWISTQDASDLSGYHLEHIRRLARTGFIKCRKWGQAWMISQSSLLEYIQEGRKKGKRRGPKKVA